MYSLPLNPPIVVGIDGSEHGLHALDWAVSTAAQRRWPVRLVNAFEPDRYILGMPSPGSTDESDAVHSAMLLDAAQKHLEMHHHIDVEVALVSRRGAVVPTLLNELEHARMLVLGRRGVGRFTELVLGSVSAACAAHGRAPVVVVPPAWTASRPITGTVVLGTDASELGEAAVGFAFEEASWRDARLDIVHTWEFPSPYGWEIAGWNGAAEWQAQAECAVAESVAGWREKYPDVEVRVMVEHAHPVQNLIQHGSTADLLVLGGRPHSELIGALARSTQAAVLHHAECPVAVVHAATDH